MSQGARLYGARGRGSKRTTPLQPKGRAALAYALGNKSEIPSTYPMAGDVSRFDDRCVRELGTTAICDSQPLPRMFIAR